MQITLNTTNDIAEPYQATSAEYNKHYLRNAILGLIKYKKPVIVTGTLQFNAYEYYYSFIDIKPFYPSRENYVKILCQHVNISKRQIDAVLNLYGEKDYTTKPLVLICKPYTYKSENTNEDRGGLNLTAELGVPGIMTYEDALRIIPTIDKSKYVDFMDFGGGYYLGIDVIKEEKKKKQIKYEKKHSKINQFVSPELKILLGIDSSQSLTKDVSQNVAKDMSPIKDNFLDDMPKKKDISKQAVKKNALQTDFLKSIDTLNHNFYTSSSSSIQSKSSLPNISSSNKSKTLNDTANKLLSQVKKSKNEVNIIAVKKPVQRKLIDGLFLKI